MKFFLLLSLLLSFKVIANTPDQITTSSSDSSSSLENSAKPKPESKIVELLRKERTLLSNNIPNLSQLTQNNICNQNEIQLIENLKHRKIKLNEWIQNTEQRELILLNLEHKLQSKILLLSELKIKIQKLLTQYSNQKDSEIKNLAKIYENMKPIEAAKIFNDLELSDLMSLFHNIKTNKISAILAKMDRTKAKIITQQIMNTDKDIKKFIN